MRVKVQNYQNAKDVDLVVEGLTVLTGNSNSGKSSTLKAFYSATHNRFRGGCVTWGEDSCVVLVKYDDDPRVLRVERSAMGSSPQVRLGNKRDGYQTFTKLNRDVPKEIADFNNFGYINLSNTEKLSLNFSTQFAEPFMIKFSNKRIVDILSYSKASADAEKARVYITNRNLELKGSLSAIESVLSETKEQLGKLQKRRNKYQDIEVLEKALADYDEVAPKVQAMQKLLSLFNESKVLESKKAKASKVVRALTVSQSNDTKLNNYRAYLTLTSQLTALQSKRDKSQSLIKVAEACPTVSESYQSLLECLLADYDVRVTTAREILDTAQTIEDLSDYENLLSLLQSPLAKRVSTAKKCLDAATKRKNSFDSLHRQYDLVGLLQESVTIQQSYNNAVEAEKNRICPICGNRIS